MRITFCRLTVVVIGILLACQALMGKSDIQVLLMDREGPSVHAFVTVPGTGSRPYRTSEYGTLTFDGSGKTTSIKISALGHPEMSISLPTDVDGSFVVNLDDGTFSRVADMKSEIKSLVERTRYLAPSEKSAEGTPVVDVKKRKEPDTKQSFTYRKHESGAVSVLNGKNVIIPESFGGKWVKYEGGYFAVGGISGNCGLYREDGSEVLSPSRGFYYLMTYDSLYNLGFISISEAGYPGLINKYGVEIISPYRHYSDILTWYYMEKGYITVLQDGYWGLCNLNGVELISPTRKYTGIDYWGDRLIEVKKGDYRGFCDLNGRELVSPDIGFTLFLTPVASDGYYIEGLIPGENDKKIYALYDINGNEVISPKNGYNHIYLNNMDKGFILASIDANEENGKNQALYDLYGNEIIPPFSSEQYFSQKIYLYDIHRGYIHVILSRSDKTPVTVRGLYDFYGDEIVSTDEEIDVINISKGEIVCKKEGGEIVKRLPDPYYDPENEELYKTEQKSYTAWDYLEAIASILQSTSDIISIATGGQSNPHSDVSSSSSSSSRTEVYSRDYRNRGTCTAFKVWRALDGVDVLSSSERVTVTEDNHGSKYMKIGGSYTLLSPNRARTYMGYTVAGYNYSAIYQGAHYFVSVM